MSYHIVGTCSICGGNVVVPTYWACIFPPTPTCQSCGAIGRPERQLFPVIPMIPNPYKTTYDHKREWKTNINLEQYYITNLKFYGDVR